MWTKVFQYFLRRFQMANGRSPMNAAEMNQIQSETVNWINKTGGKTLPGTPQSQKPPIQGFTPRVIEGGKGKAGIGTLLKDSPEAIAKIKAENKAAIERLKAKKKTVEDFRDEGDFDPGGMASGGIAGPLHLYDGGRARFKDGSWSKLKKKYKGSTLQAMLDNPQLMAAELGHEGIFNLLQMLGMKEGGRARFDKGKKVDLSKRRFIKGTGATLGVLSMLPFVGKFFKAAKLSKAAAPAAEVITKGTSGIPDYAYNLIEVVKAKGTKEIMEGVYKRNPPSVKYNYKGVEVVEDGMGNTSVKKEIEGFGVDEAGEGYEGISREVGFDINKGENIVKQGGKGDDAGKVIQTDDDYFEATVRPDSECKMKDMEEFISVEDHLDLKKIAEEAKDITIKKAEGGRIGYAKGTKKRGEGQYSPTKDKAWMQTMPTIDPRLRKLMEEHKKRKGLAEILGV